MSDYKLVPVEPTAGMVEAYERASIAPVGPISKNGYKAMLAAAPAVQGENVGEAGSLPGTKGFTTAVFESSKVPEGTKLYTAPQPSPDVTQMVEALEELVDLMQGVIEGDYVPDSFTLQPATTALAAYRKGAKK